jgi:squalene-hopene/tetraprenyl-beta-curcumene cyclase
MRVLCLYVLPLALALSQVAPGAAQEKEKKGPPKGKSWDEMAAAAAGYLKTTQADDGSWSKATHPGITGVVLTGLFKSGQVKAGDPVAAKGLKFVESLADSKEGHLAVGEQIRHKFYTTSVNLQALKASGDKKYDAVVAAAAAYFKNGQTGATDKKTPEDPNYGGFGYGPGTRGDVSNTHFALDALVAAGTPKDDPVFKRAVVFVSRCQNLKSEFNDQPFAGKINDGSFIYVLPAAGGMAPVDTPRPGYGSMTYAGIKCLALGGVGAEDPRRKKAMEWVAHNYSVDINPGRGDGAGGQGYYYYLVSMARCLDTLGVGTVTDAAGKAHDWRADVTRALANRQRRDGSWGNDFGQWMEGDPNLDTAYALIALGYARPQAK